jgi:predicted nucleic acid-binding protein
MIVISDTTPLRYLIEIEAVHILETLFGKVIIPQKVADELQGRNTPQKVKDWMQALPGWLEVRQADLSLFTPVFQLHAGEWEAFALAIELKADVLLIDERNGRREAKRIGQFVIPTLAVLEMAAESDLIDLPEVVGRLSKTTFHAAQKLYDDLLERDRKRKAAKK